MAGLAAAAALGEHGLEVDLLEARPRLGGRASSFHDTASGQFVDNCQHVALGCCTNFLDFCRRTDIDDLLRREKTLYFIDPQGRLNPISASPLPAPLHLMPAFARSRLLATNNKWRVALGLLQLCGRGYGNHARADTSVRFADWLDEHAQPKQAIDQFWSVILTSALSEELRHIDVAHARKVFRDAFLAHPRAWEMLVPAVPLSELYGTRLIEALTRCRVKVHFHAALRRVCMRQNQSGVEAVELRDGSRLRAPAYLFAVPPDRLLRILPQALFEREPYFGRLRQLQSAPITSVHFWFDRPITRLPHAVIVGRTSQWIFNRSALHRAAGTRDHEETSGPLSSRRSAHSNAPAPHYYQVVISASRQLERLDTSEILQAVRNDLNALFPAARPAGVLHARVVTERSAVFSVRPGAESLRPAQLSPIGNLFLAGDWTQTGWPATMEGAVRSGYLAAETLLASQGRKVSILRPDLVPSPLARLVLEPAG